MKILLKYIVVNDNRFNDPLRDIAAIGPGEDWKAAIWKDLFFKCRNCPSDTKVWVNNCDTGLTAEDMWEMASMDEFIERSARWAMPKAGELPGFSVQFLEENWTTDIGFRTV